jgi:hypothetical protein
LLRSFHLPAEGFFFEVKGNQRRKMIFSGN